MAEKHGMDGAFPHPARCSRRGQAAAVPGARGSGDPSCLLRLALPAYYGGHRLVILPLAGSEDSVAPGLRIPVDDDPGTPSLCRGRG